MKKILVFCSSRTLPNKSFSRDAVKIGKLVADNGFELVYGGGKSGLMGDVAESAIKNGGVVNAIYPSWMYKEIFETSLFKKICTKTLSDRKAKMLEMSDYIIALAGGIGTLDELSEAWALASLDKLKSKKIFILNTEKFYDKLMGFFSDCEVFGTMKSANVCIGEFYPTPEDIFERISKLERLTQNCGAAHE